MGRVAVIAHEQVGWDDSAGTAFGAAPANINSTGSTHLAAIMHRSAFGAASGHGGERIADAEAVGNEPRRRNSARPCVCSFVRRVLRAASASDSVRTHDSPRRRTNCGLLMILT
jgi:hypothetical protein